jgi:hypothetical protein
MKYHLFKLVVFLISFSLLTGCFPSEETPVKWIEKVTLRYDAVNEVGVVNEPTIRATGYVFSVDAQLNLGTMEPGERFNARVKWLDPALQEAVGEAETVFPLEGEYYTVNPQFSSYSAHSYPYHTNLSPYDMQRLVDQEQVMLEVYTEEEILVSEPVVNLEIDEPYYGESEHWWVSTDLYKQFGEEDEDPHFFTLSFVYRGEQEDIHQFKRVVFAQGTELNSQAVTLSHVSDTDQGCGGLLVTKEYNFTECQSGHFFVKFELPDITFVDPKQAVDNGGMLVQIYWETEAGETNVETIRIPPATQEEG